MEKVLKRIKISNKTIKFIINFFQNRTLKAIIKHELIKEIIAGDGLNQEKMITLFCKEYFIIHFFTKFKKYSIEI